MALTPDFDSFAAAYDAGENQLVYTRLAADLDTPVSLMLKLTGAQKDAFILESVTGGEVRGRYSIIGMKPDLVWRCRGDKSEINRTARFDADGFAPQDGDPLDNLRALLAESRIDLPDDLPQAAAGLFWLSRLRHGASRRTSARREPGSARSARCNHDAPIGGGGSGRGQG